MESRKVIQVEEKVPFKMLVPLSIQHMFAMFGASVLVPFIFQINPAIVLLMNGVGTLLFILITKGKAPAYLGSSFAFLAPAGIVISKFGYPYALGGFVAVGVCGCILAFIIYKFGTEWIDVVLPPAAMGPVVALIGLELSSTAASNAGLLEETVDPKNVIVFIVTLGTAVLGSVLFKKFLSVIPILIAILVGYAAALLCGIVDFTEVAAAPWFALPNFVMPKFNISAILIILPVLLVTASEHVGHQIVTSKIVGRELLKDPGLHRSLFADYFSTALSGMIGSVPTTTKHWRNGSDQGIQRICHRRCCGFVHRSLPAWKAFYADQYDTGAGNRGDFFSALRHDRGFGDSYSGGLQGGLRQLQESYAYVCHICDRIIRDCIKNGQY